ncbi:hypothetical protein VLK31_02785 [Variovorax sp. H27-G14]|uniref:hypothetical protein n=1 Tax=Variovorax sp. H27-G14 TaxID=3111914 RepID=UPI0038FBE692
MSDQANAPDQLQFLHTTAVVPTHRRKKNMANKRIIESTAAMTALAQIGLKAVEHHEAESAPRARLEDLRTAYRDHSHERGLGFIEKQSPAWPEMEAACVTEYCDLVAAKAVVYNSPRRFATAIRRAGVSA